MQNDLANGNGADIESVDTKTEYAVLPEDDAQIKIELPEERVPTDSTVGEDAEPISNDGEDSPAEPIGENDDAKKDTPASEASFAVNDGEGGADGDLDGALEPASDSDDGLREDGASKEGDTADIENGTSEDLGDGEEGDADVGGDNLSEDGDSLPEGDIDAEPIADGEGDEDYVQISLFDDDDAEKTAADEGDESEEPKGYDPDHPRFIDSIFDFVELFIFSLVAVLLATTFIFRHTVVDGSSMEQTLYDGEHLIISNLFYTPQRGDIIVCVDYSTVHKKPIVKRIIGLPGDEVKVYANGAVYVNGEKLEEDYVYNDFIAPQEYVEKTVEEGRLFVMGDHRNLSSDSRTIGTIDMDSVLGRVVFRFYPFDKFGKVE